MSALFRATVVLALLLRPSATRAQQDDPKYLYLLLRDSSVICAPREWERQASALTIVTSGDAITRVIPADSIAGAWTAGLPDTWEILTSGGFMIGGFAAFPVLDFIKPLGRMAVVNGKDRPEIAFGIGAAVGMAVEVFIRSRRYTRLTWRGDLTPPGALNTVEAQRRLKAACTATRVHPQPELPH